ncbi:caveolin-1-like [Liolophura sinensis]|uniref:caveolin-1-like n=1 Tax=Liolophura sinensis TaxID=3198878 RepID=UPI0031590B6B
MDLDLVNRDPNSINNHVQVAFEDVLAEPEDVRSMNCVWKFTYKCFTLWKQLCYNIATFCCGLCIAMNWGCIFAETAFYHIWYITPYLKWLEINCEPMRKLFRMCLSCCLDPVCESIGTVFHACKKGDSV